MLESERDSIIGPFAEKRRTIRSLFVLHVTFAITSKKRKHTHSRQSWAIANVAPSSIRRSATVKVLHLRSVFVSYSPCLRRHLPWKRRENDVFVKAAQRGLHPCASVLTHHIDSHSARKTLRNLPRFDPVRPRSSLCYIAQQTSFFKTANHLLVACSSYSDVNRPVYRRRDLPLPRMQGN